MKLKMVLIDTLYKDCQVYTNDKKGMRTVCQVLICRPLECFYTEQNFLRT